MSARKNVSPFNIMGWMSNFEIRQTPSLKKNKKTIVNTNSYCKTIKKKKIQLEFPNALLPCLHIKERVRDTDRGRKRTKTIRKNRNESNWGITERSSRAN